MSTNDIHVQCTRCKNKHKESERLSVQIKKPKGFTDLNVNATALVCPRCNCKSFYNIEPIVAYCWATGLIEFADAAPQESITIATGPKAYLVGTVSALARHGLGASKGKFLVPGIPEADDQAEAGDALDAWLKWCAKNNGKKHRHGVIFSEGAKA